jgi:hypothetical protein
MLNLAERFKRIPQTRYLGPAKVLEKDEDSGQICLRLTGHPQAGTLLAQDAIAGQNGLQTGDTVLVVGEDLEDLYVIGVLSCKETPDSSESKIKLTKGAHVETEGSTGEQILKVFSPKREMIFEYDEENNRARVNLEAGDLEFITQRGNITFASNKEIMFHGRSIGMTGSKGICLGIVNTLGKLRSTLTLRQQSIKIDSPEFTLNAERGDLNVEEAKYTGNRLLSKVDRLETIAVTVMAKARNIYRTVEELSQVRAGRMRTMVAKTFHFKSKKAFVKAEEDYKIKAEKIHLG